MTKTGLVLEGGAMRGLFSAGIMDVMLEAGIAFDGIIGVSAGAAFGCNYKSHQAGRAVRYNKRFARDSRYCGLRSLLTTGNLFNADFAYHVVPERYDLFDNATFEADPTEFYVVCTDVDTGEAVYKRLSRGGHEAYEWIRASASMPVVSRVVELEGRRLLDGGMADSIPLERFQQMGYGRCVVILTQPADYEKRPSRFLPLIRRSMRHYPQVVAVMERRHEMYNRELTFVRNQVALGRALAIYPREKLPIGHVSHDADAMQHVYEIGRQAGKERLEEIKAFIVHSS